MIQVEQVHRHYETGGERVEVLTGVDLRVDAGETVALTGESGSGKTTLLHLIAAFDRPDSGRIAVAGTDLAGLDDAALSQFRRATLGMVFQQFNLLSPLSVEDNIRFPQRLVGRDDQEWLGHVVDALQLAPLLDRWPDQLSGGQQQRVALARALSHRPPLLLADEPTGNLDEDNSDAVMALMTDLVNAGGTTLVMVTHSRHVAGFLARQVCLEHGRLLDGS